MLPLLRLTGIGRNAANITVIGVTLGLTFGAGLLLRDIRSGTLSRRDVWLAIGFLGLAHSLIEDTLLILLIGADLSGILWARLVFAIGLIGLLARLPVMRRVLDEPAQRRNHTWMQAGVRASSRPSRIVLPSSSSRACSLRAGRRRPPAAARLRWPRFSPRKFTALAPKNAFDRLVPRGAAPLSVDCSTSVMTRMNSCR